MHPALLACRLLLLPLLPLLPPSLLLLLGCLLLTAAIAAALRKQPAGELTHPAMQHNSSSSVHIWSAKK
jgi:hypothetical protein